MQAERLREPAVGVFRAVECCRGRVKKTTTRKAASAEVKTREKKEEKEARQDPDAESADMTQLVVSYRIVVHPAGVALQ